MENGSPIVGFEKEMASFRGWLANADARMELFAISGIAGIGKTTLLMEIAREADDAGALTLWMDGNHELSTSLAFLTGMEMTLASEYGAIRPPETPLFDFIVGELSRRRCVLLLDNAESIERIEGWLLSSFLPKLSPSQLLIAAASRNGLPLKWMTNPYLCARTRAFRLEPLTRREVQAYLRQSGLDEEKQARIASEAEGHPLLLALTVDWMRTGLGDTRIRIPSLMTAELLREAATTRLQHALTAMSLLPSADLSLLNRLLDDPLEPPDAHELGRLSFVQTDFHGWALHPLAARMLREDYATTFPESFLRLRDQVFRLLAERFRESGKRYQMRIAGHILELYREYLPSTNEYAVFSTPVRTGSQQPYGQGDMPELQRLLASSVADNNWQTELADSGDYAALLDDIARVSPEGICVIRDEAGEPIAFCAGMMLHGGAIPLLNQYFPNLESVLGKEEEAAFKLSPEEGDTILMVLAAVDSSRRFYSPEELGGVLMLQWLIRMTEGLRGIMVSADQRLNGLLAMLGFRNTGTVGDTARWEIDFRHASFEHWVHDVILQTGGSNAEQANESGSPMPLVEADVKLILRHLYEGGEALEPFVGTARAGGFRSLTELREKALSLLSTDPPVQPLTDADQRILRGLYISGDKNKNELAEELHMSRTTLYRHSRAAISRFAYAMNRTQGSSGPVGIHMPCKRTA